MATSTLTPERALRRPFRIDLRAVLSLLVTVAAIGGMLLYANSFAVTRALLIFTRDLPAGAVLTAAEIQQEMRSQYAISYTPTNSDRNGEFRKIEIRPKSKEGFFPLR